jgi:hypothetical protein
MALSARDAGITDVRIVPIGINYEKKDGLRSRVLVEVGQPIAVDLLTPEAAQVDTLTAEIARRLSAVTLNFDDERDSLEVLDLATILAAATTEIRPLGEPDASVATTVDVARRTDQIRSLLERGELPLRVEERVRRIQRRLMALNRTARKLDIRLADVALDTRLPAAVRFVVRELLLGVFGVPIALWGRITHLLPFTLATSLGARTSRSRSERAMNTILLGLALVPMAYGIQTFIVWRLAGPWWSALYLASLIPSASWNLVYTERLTQLRRRVLAWRHFRQDPGLQEKLRSELFALRDEAAGIASALAP